MTPLLKRTISAVLLVAVLIGCLLLHPLCCAALFAAALALMAGEFYRMAMGRGTHKLPRALALCLIAGVCLASFLIKYYRLGLHWLLLAFPLLLVVLAAVLLDREKRIEVLTAQDICFPVAYMLPSFMISQMLLFDRAGNYSPYLFIAVMVLVWINDVSAYAAGMAFGQRQNSRKLAPHISPNKSWAGAIGSVVFTLAAGACLYLLGFFPIKLWQWLIAAFIVVVFGIFGDLFESLVKRHYGVKDSGNIIAGHGGMWDRFDGALFAIPAVTVFFILTSII